MAAALIEAVIAAIEEEDLLENVRRLSKRIRESCRVGPVTDVQGAGFLLGLRTGPPAGEVSAALLERGILTGSSADPHVVRILAPLVLETEHVDRLAHALKEINR
jgi:acetylornithine/succinyldiaminopimelate/putrescine aminotransferase